MKRALGVVLLNLVLTVAVAQPVGVAAASATAVGSQATPASVPLAGGPAGQLSPEMYAGIKAALNRSPDFSRTVSVSGNTRTLTYTYRTGSAFVFTEPVGNTSQAAVSPNLGVGGCNFLTICVYLDRSDQTVIAAGGAAFLAQALCMAFPPACPIAWGAMTSAATWLAFHPYCSHMLVITLFPWPGSIISCY
jgi:hypothetical protein